MTEVDQTIVPWRPGHAIPLGIATGMHLAKVIEFSDQRGLGVVDIEGRRFPFHCLSIADGSRTLEVDSLVCVRLAASQGGGYQAIEVVKI